MIQSRGTCSAEGCTAPLPYAGTGRPQRYCTWHRAEALAKQSTARTRRFRERARAANVVVR